MGNICKLLQIETPDPCPNKDEKGACEGCIDTWRDRSAIVADGCKISHEQAEEVARQMMRAALKGQRKLF